MNCNFSPKDIKNIEEIRLFLENNDISYSTEYSNFCLWYDQPDKRKYEIEYVPSKLFPINYPQYGIAGVDKNFFFKLSHKAEHQDNSFKLWIKDFEWQNDRQREILKSYILHASKKTPYSFYARDCYIKEVPSMEARNFEAEHCFYGKRGASLNLGLYLKKEKHNLPANTLLMIYTFGNNFFAKTKGIIEVIRVGTRKFSNVIGGSSKLFQHFVKNYPIITIGKSEIKVKSIKFYSDYDHNLGNSMEQLGFQFIGYSKGGFVNYWVEKDIIKHRQPMHHKEIMEQTRLGKVIAIPNAGTKNYIFNV